MNNLPQFNMGLEGSGYGFVPLVLFDCNNQVRAPPR